MSEGDRKFTEMKGFPYFLQPNPCRKFKFSDSPSHGICFPIFTNFCSESALNGKYEQLWQINTIVNSRTLTVIRNIRNNLFDTKRNPIIISDKISDDKINNGKIIENMKNYPETKEIFHFLPVIIQVKNVQKTVELFRKRKFQNSSASSMSVVRTWTVNSKNNGILDDLRAGET